MILRFLMFICLDRLSLVGVAQGCSSARLHEKTMGCIDQAGDEISAAKRDCEKMRRACDSASRDLLIAQESLEHLSERVRSALELNGISASLDTSKLMSPSTNDIVHMETARGAQHYRVIRQAELLFRNISLYVSRKTTNST
jgi:hypothetical protein